MASINAGEAFKQSDMAYSDFTFPPRLLEASPEEIKDYVRHIHASDISLEGPDLDILLLGSLAVDADREVWGDAKTFYSSLEQKKYPGEKAWDGRNEGIWTPYRAIRSIVNSLNLSSASNFYDLGAGYGRLVLYAGITTDAQCTGIEMVAERVERVKASIARLGLLNAEFICGKVQEVDYSAGDVFYLYLPFSNSTFDIVLDQLDEIAARKPITIVSRGSSVKYAQGRGLLKNMDFIKTGGEGFFAAEFYESADIAHTPLSRIVAARS